MTRNSLIRLFVGGGTVLTTWLATWVSVAEESAPPSAPPSAPAPTEAPVPASGKEDDRTARAIAEAANAKPLTPEEILAIQLTRTIQHPDALAGLSPEEIVRMKGGEVVIAKEIRSEQANGENGALGFVQAAMVINQPVEKVWPLIKETEVQHRFLPRLDRSKLIWRNAEFTHDAIDFFLSFWFIDIDYRVRHYYDDANYHSSFWLDPEHENDISEFVGYWWAYSDGPDRTILRYGVHFSIGWIIPESLQEYLTRRDLPEALGNCKKHKDSLGTWKKPDYDPDMEK